MFFTQGLRRFAKEPEFVFGCEFGVVTSVVTAIDHRTQNLPGRDRQRLAIFSEQIKQEKRGSGLPWYGTQGAEIDRSLGVGIAGMPTGVLAVIVEDVRHVPAEDDVAE